MEERVKIAITQGDINGVGYEIILKTFANRTLMDACIPVVYGSPKVFAYYKKVLGLDKIPHNTIRHISEAVANQLNVIDCNSEEVKVDIGQPTKEAGLAAFQALERAMTDAKEGLFPILVTAPINKDTIQSSEFHFPGHTDYLQENLNAQDVVMLMVQDDLRVAVATAHISLGEVANALDKDLIFSKIKALNTALKYNFGLPKPKIAVLGVNPHAGDNGLLGKEEVEIIQPAIEEAKSEGIIAIGPFAADGFFGSGSFVGFDAILAMYHDQGLIPFKTLAAGGGVNFTTGLPIVRTSPAHGTAYDIVAKGEASEASFKEAILEAIRIYKERVFQNECAAKGLEIKDRKNYQRRTYRPHIS